MEKAVTFVLDRLNAFVEWEKIVGAKAQLVKGMNYDVTFTLDNAETWKAVVYRSLTGDFSIVKEAKKICESARTGETCPRCKRGQYHEGSDGD